MGTATQTQDEFTAGAEVPASAIVVHSGPVMELASPHDIAKAVRQRDDEQILATIMGEALAVWFYKFRISGKDVEGVSVTGAMEFARIRAEQGFPIRFPPGAVTVEELIQNGELGIRCTVVSRCARTGAEGIGMAFYPWNAKKTDGSTYLDDKADRKALSVAKRNSILDLIPESMVITVLKERERLVAANEARRVAGAVAMADAAVAGRTEVRRLTTGELRQESARTVYDEGAPNGGAPKCPKCSGAMWDNAQKNEQRAKEGKKRMPSFTCKNRESCDGVIWGSDKKEEAAPAAAPAAKPKSQPAAAGSKAAAAVLECPACGKNCQQASDHHPECPRYAD